jgi:site-specific DNA-cytosine methylase
MLPPGKFKVITASVPCTEYSLTKTTAPRDMPMADELVSKVMEIVEYFNPKVWWIENPRNGYLRHRDVLKGYPFVDIDYC